MPLYALPPSSRIFIVDALIFEEDGIAELFTVLSFARRAAIWRAIMIEINATAKITFAARIATPSQSKSFVVCGESCDFDV